jgi:hypothetical protein
MNMQIPSHFSVETAILDTLFLFVDDQVIFEISGDELQMARL